MSKYKDEPLDHKKYALMGVNPRELYLRQTKHCWLELIYDINEDNEEVLSAVYCTDGEEYAETNKMVNPTFECIQCLTECIIKGGQKNEGS